MDPQQEQEIRERLERIFPNLKTTQYKIMSPEDTRYNCVSWAIHDYQDDSYPIDWWEPTPLLNYYWPLEKNRDYSVQSYQEMFEMLGYSVCKSSQYLKGFTKITIFSLNGIFKHVCRQDVTYPNMWLSKIGQNVDIEHDLDGLSGDFYGYPTVFMEMKN
jgi:hypothetical protein